ncbi:MAG TPA: hypothetical protein VKB78_05420, partial [Pirellulales bacterium]|nr:hypothetical protein [Pirellulales bacterium]
MSSEVALATKPPVPVKPDARRSREPRRHKASPITTLAARGEPMVWLTGGALAISMLMVVGLLVLIIYQGIGTFWPAPLESVTTVDKQVYLGELARTEMYRPEERVFRELPRPVAERAREQVAKTDGVATRRLYRVGNVELTQAPFRWVDDFMVDRVETPNWAMVVERLDHGRFYGELQAMLI